MQIVIEIPKEIVESVRNDEWYMSVVHLREIAEAIKLGTPLPDNWLARMVAASIIKEGKE